MGASERHSLLRRQLKKHFRDAPVPEELESFLDAVDHAYRQSDDDRLMLERSLDLSSDELFHANAELRTLFQSLPDLVLRVDADGTIVDVKAGSPADLLMSPSALLGRRLQDAPLELLGELGFEDCLLEVLSTGELRTLEYRLKVNGGRKHYEARMRRFSDRQVLVVVRDITDRERALAELTDAKAMLEARVASRTAELRDANEALIAEIAERKAAEKRRRRLEAKLLQSQKLESLGVLAGGIAHDFNNLLMTIMGNAALAVEDLPHSHPARAKLQEVEAASRRASQLTQQMLSYAGKGTVEVERVDLSLVAEGMANLLEVSISKKTRLVYELLRGLPRVRADAAQLGQVVMNLITNASEALGENGGTVTLSTGLLDVDREYLNECFLAEELGEGSYVYVEVSDNGNGMSAETVQKIFDPFFTTKFTGRGLGLAAVLGIVRAHGGAIRVSSAEHRGTKFTVLLPPADGGERERPIAREEEVAERSTVLVVDDDPAVRRVIRTTLERHGYRALMAEDGRDGVGVYHRHRDEIDCIVMDLTMPVMDGRQALAEIRRSDATVPVIVMSGYAREDTAQRFAGSVGVEFLQKPFVPMDLIERLAGLGVSGPEDAPRAKRRSRAPR